jgi:hypothetical protein
MRDSRGRNALRSGRVGLAFAGESLALMLGLAVTVACGAVPSERERVYVAAFAVFG